jgi:hypothetical protein
MNSTAGTAVVGSMMLSTAAVLATGLLWASAALARERWGTDRSAEQQRELRQEVAELGQRVAAVQRLLEGVD